MSELTGGRVNYYLVQVAHPQREDQAAYQAECEDIIQALGMDFNEGCLFKALWRSAAARQGNGKPGAKAKYDAEKMVHYANRILRSPIIEEAEPEPVKQNWHAWSGNVLGPIMSSETRVHIRFRSGTYTKDILGKLDWLHTGRASDIMSYMLDSDQSADSKTFIVP